MKGVNKALTEQEFIRIAVDSAVDLINRKGKNAFTDISSNISQYNFREIRVFVFQKNGKIIVSPVADSDFSQIKLLECTDETGHKPFAKAVQALEDNDHAWQIFMAKQRDKRMLLKKVLYLRKTSSDGKVVYVGAITDLPHPP